GANDSAGSPAHRRPQRLPPGRTGAGAPPARGMEVAGAPHMILSYDAIIIGTGQAGPPLAGRLTAAGMKVAVIERGRVGGTCVNTGCIPTKTMVVSAYAAHLARRAAEYGVTIAGPVTVDMKQVKARKDQISGKSNQGVETWLKNMANCVVYEGHGRFESPREVSVG